MLINLILILSLILPSLTYAFDCGYGGYKGCSIAEIEQIGIKNNVYIEQAPLNKTSTLQEGINNNVIIKQNVKSFANSSYISQLGINNSAYLTQKGMSNFSYSSQTGSLNSLEQNQMGKANIATALQFGVGNSIEQNQYSSHNTANALQIGFYNKLYQIQGLAGTIGNKSNLSQIGYGVLTVIIQ